MEAVLTASETDLAPFARISTEVRHANRVSDNDLVDLAAGRVLAIVVEDYCPPELCREAARKLINDHRYGEYDNVPGVHKWGLNTYEGLSSAEREQRYFAEAVPAIQALRDSWSPHLSPIDRLRLELQEAWPAGANMGFFKGHKLFVGQARVFPSGGNGAIPHQDFLPWELQDLNGVTDVGEVPTLVGQLTVNLYLQTPASGGELELWAHGYDHDEYDALRASADSYGLNRELVPAPDAVLRPIAGMLIMFHASRVHAVRPAQGVDRVALSSFIGVHALDQPLTYWS
ncbi:hypothetical protein GCM10012275_10410 [Longimycelium tulufanense]|uniref:Uncharacterized protein n=1 Tax=Longimycelium tulufanense TaxID=907463 RepID=A0A8J3CB23_9PSEU|nr:2OG-Fe(II) oxygenase [Longimycelium tulufanense]GGM41335.1 hypothetical protein GCM10012275_10410 [Longimycelium tulufanense]